MLLVSDSLYSATPYSTNASAATGHAGVSGILRGVLRGEVEGGTRCEAMADFAEDAAPTLFGLYVLAQAGCEGTCAHGHATFATLSRRPRRRTCAWFNRCGHARLPVLTHVRGLALARSFLYAAVSVAVLAHRIVVAARRFGANAI